MKIRQEGTSQAWFPEAWDSSEITIIFPDETQRMLGGSKND
ncbi:hypothetical protein [Clostridium cibarium]|nr:hypothetical protein [Clostridium cibarium]